MADLIDRQTIIEAIHSAIYPYFCGAEDGDALSEDEKLVLSVNKAVCTAIKALPSADVDLSDFSDKLWKTAYERGKAEVVRHGRWIEEPNCMYRCSSCGNHYPSIRGYMYYCYCPSCGARMDGE